CVYADGRGVDSLGVERAIPRREITANRRSGLRQPSICGGDVMHAWVAFLTPSGYLRASAQAGDQLLASASSACARPRNENGIATSRPAASTNLTSPVPACARHRFNWSSLTSRSAKHPPGRQRRHASSVGCWSLPSTANRTTLGNDTFTGATIVSLIGSFAPSDPKATCKIGFCWPWAWTD